MDLGGIIAGAMAGGGQAIQQNAQSQLEQQRKEALAELEQRMARDNLDYKYDKESEIAAQEAEYEAAQQAQQARLDRQADIRASRLNIAEDAASQATEARLSGGNSGRTREDVLEERDQEIQAAIENEQDRRQAYPGLEPENPLDADQIAREVSRRYSRLYPEYENDLMRGFSSAPRGGGNAGLPGNDPLNLRN